MMMISLLIYLQMNDSILHKEMMQDSLKTHDGHQEE